MIGCSPKVVKPTEEVDVVPLPTKQEPKNPCTGFADLSSKDREIAETSFVLYKDEIKQKKFREGLSHWRIAYNLAPGSNGRVKSHFDDGVNIFKHLYETTVDAELKQSYIDTIMMIYDKRKVCFGDEAYVNGLKGFDYYYYFSSYITNDSIYKLLKSNFDVKGKDADYFVINPFTKLLADKMTEGSISKDEGRKYADLIFRAIGNGLATCKGDGCETWKIINEYAPLRLESLEGIDGFYDCAYYSSKYYPLFKMYPDSCEIINLAYARMLRGDCGPNDKQLMEIKNVKTTKCYVAPPALNCAAQGNEDYGLGKYSKAIESYLSCVETSTDKDQKAKYLLLIAKIYYRDLKNYTKARKYAFDAAKIKPSWGEPYLLIGNLYASSGPLCGTGRGWESQIVTWPAIDMWTKAKNIDTKSANEANQLINRYKQYMPSKEDIFFRQIKQGDSFFVPCWIQENTIVRTSD